MSKKNLDQATAAIHDHRMDDDAVAAAADRVHQSLLGATAGAAIADAPARLASCDDYRALLGPYLRGALTEGQAALVEDHTRSCIPCRRALRQAREGTPASVDSAVASDSGRGRRVFAVAAAVAGLALGGWAWNAGLLAPPIEQIAQVRAIDGSLIRVDGSRLPVGPGDWLSENERVRTADGSVSFLRLADGSMIEVGERTLLSLHERRGDVTVQVERGDVIVEAADQRGGELSVATQDVLVSVKGTIFAVGNGAKGTRVAVVEGEVQVEAGREERLLFPGDQFLSNRRLAMLPFESAISWSQDADRYLEQLHEVRELRRELASVALAPDLRHSTRLLDLVPWTPAAYISAPNLGASLEEARGILDARLAGSPALQEWWDANVGETGVTGSAEEVFDLLQKVAGELGPEVVVAASLEGGGLDGSAVVMAELNDPAGFSATLDEVIAEVTGDDEDRNFQVRFLVDPLVSDASDSEILLWIDGDVLVASSDLAAIQAVARAMSSGSPFVGTSLHQELTARYEEGVEALAGIDVGAVLEGALAESPEADAGVLEWTGIGDAEHFVIDSKTIDDTTQIAAELDFDQPRRGVMAWLSAPAPMGSLEYVSADATAAGAVLFMDPLDVVDQLFELMGRLEGDAMQGLADAESQLGLGIREDLAAPLGGEIAVALDGPALPVPAWKVVIEVNDANRLQSSLQHIVTRVNEMAAAEGTLDVAVQLTEEEIDGRVYTTISSSGEAEAELVYTFDESYMVAAPSRVLVDRALATRQSQYTFLDAPKLRDLMPVDGYLNFSGLAYQDLGSVVEPIAAAAAAVVGQLSEEDQQLVAELSSDVMRETLVSLYGEESAIRLVGTAQGGLFGGALDSLLGAGQMLELGRLLQLDEADAGGAAPQ